MKTLPSKITHISSNAEFKPISMNLGGDIKLKQITKGNLTTKIGSIHHIDIDEGINSKLWISPIGENFI